MIFLLFLKTDDQRVREVRAQAASRRAWIGPLAGSLPEPGILAAEIVEDLQAALEQFAEIAEELGEEE